MRAWINEFWWMQMLFWGGGREFRKPKEIRTCLPAPCFACLRLLRVCGFTQGRSQSAEKCPPADIRLKKKRKEIPLCSVSSWIRQIKLFHFTTNTSCFCYFLIKSNTFFPALWASVFKCRYFIRIEDIKKETNLWPLLWLDDLELITPTDCNYAAAFQSRSINICFWA